MCIRDRCKENAEEPPKFSVEKKEAIFMCGLPSSGKTTYANSHSEKHKDKRYLIIGTGQILEHILSTVYIRELQPSLITLMEICNIIAAKLLRIASKLNRNIIIDQCHAIPAHRVERIIKFHNFQKTAMVIVPTEVELHKRVIKKEKSLQKGPRFLIEAMRNFKECFSIPRYEEGFDKIEFVELPEKAAQELTVINNEIATLQVHPLLREKKHADISAYRRFKGATNIDFMELILAGNTTEDFLPSKKETAFDYLPPCVNISNNPEEFVKTSNMYLASVDNPILRVFMESEHQEQGAVAAEQNGRNDDFRREFGVNSHIRQQNFNPRYEFAPDRSKENPNPNNLMQDERRRFGSQKPPAYIPSVPTEGLPPPPPVSDSIKQLQENYKNYVQVHSMASTNPSQNSNPFFSPQMMNIYNFLWKQYNKTQGEEGSKPE
eukprot:TRINITY_DN5519_c0_g3_i4.p1 TRINITY_DN5519_c0_g3~~TRINITY_DN5519_c0_g3_i4.p1  ORF type:complete len:435 (+),score=104.52 TRINITY_DN5519_c0_g3_i4:68-1372(+)